MICEPAWTDMYASAFGVYAHLERLYSITHDRGGDLRALVKVCVQLDTKRTRSKTKGVAVAAIGREHRALERSTFPGRADRSL